MSVALIPGGARGIGRAIGLALAARGDAVSVLYRSSEADAKTFVSEAAAKGGRGHAIRADVSRPEDVARAVAETESALGPIDILVHAAGPYHRVELLAETPEGWREMIESNLTSLFLVSRIVGPKMAERGKGRIVAFSMANADRLSAQPGVTAHYIAKAGVLVLVRTLAKVLGPKGVTVNAISPGFIASGSAPAEELEKMKKTIPAGYVGTLDDAVGLTMFLLSDGARYVNGANVHLSGGWGI